MSKNKHSLEIKMAGFWRKFFQETLGTPEEFIIEALDNIPDYSQSSDAYLHIFPDSNILVVEDTGQGIGNPYWKSFTHELLEHLHKNSKWGFFGEGVRKAGLVSSEKHEMFVLTNVSSLKKMALFKANRQKTKVDVLNQIPSWMKNNPLLKKHSTGTLVCIKVKQLPDIQKLEKTIQDEYNLALQQGFNIFFKIWNQNTATTKQIFSTNYGSTRVNNLTLKGSSIPTTIFENAQEQLGHAKWYLFGKLILDERPFRTPIVAAIDISAYPHMKSYLLPNKKAVTDRFRKRTINKIYSQLFKKYPNQSAVNQTLQQACNQVLTKLMATIANKPRTGKYAFTLICMNQNCPYFLKNGIPYTEVGDRKKKKCKHCKKFMRIVRKSKPSSNSNKLQNPKTNLPMVVPLNGNGQEFITFSYPQIFYDVNHPLAQKLTIMNIPKAVLVFTPYLERICRTFKDPTLRNNIQWVKQLEFDLKDLTSSYLKVI